MSDKFQIYHLTWPAKARVGESFRVAADISTDGSLQAVQLKRVYVDVLCKANVICDGEVEESDEETIAQQRQV